MFPGDARRARLIGRRITDARRAGGSSAPCRDRRRAEAMVEQLGPDVRREIEVGRREQLRGKRG